MVRLEQIEARAAQAALSVLGAFQCDKVTGVPDGTQTLVLLGPNGASFWPAVSSDPEFQDGAPDPLDRWSERVIGTMASEWGATPLFPFTGPPYHPFYQWAVASGAAWPSPVALLVHERAGLWVSYRGALAFRERLELPDRRPSPCVECTQPCLTACPAHALGAAGYDVGACHTYLDTQAGQDCLNGGCKVRKACPAGESYGRMAEQSAFHMAAFHP